MKGPPSDPNTPFQGQGTHTLPHQHHYQKQHQQQHATLPRTSVIQDINTQTQVSNFQSLEKHIFYGLLFYLHFKILLKLENNKLMIDFIKLINFSQCTREI